MVMKNIIVYSQIIVSVLLIISILLQQRGSALSNTFGGDGGVFTSRRGAEKWLFIVTIILAVIFFGLAIASLIL